MINNQWQWIQVTVTAHTLQCYIKELQTFVNEPIYNGNSYLIL